MSQLESRYTLDNSGFVAKMVESGTVMEREAKRMQKSLDYVSAQLKVMERDTKSATAASGDLKEAGAHMEEFGFKTAGAKRELLVLGHELSQGNFSRFGGSLLVLGERTGAAALLFSGMGIAVLAATAAVGAFAAAAVQGSRESEALRKSLVLTGNFAGVTADEFRSSAERISKSSTRSIGGIKEIQQALISTGQFGPREFGPATEAVAKLEKLSGQSAEEIVKDFAKMQDGVVKWAEEHNRAMHFTSASHIELARQLDETGQHEQAVLLILGDLNKQLNTTASFWDKLKLATSQAWDEMAGNGRAETLGERLGAIDKRLAEIDKQHRFRMASPAFSSAPDTGASQVEKEQLNNDRRVILMDQLRQKEKAAGDAETARVQQAGISANERMRQILAETKGVENLQKQIANAKRDFADAAAAGTPFSEKEQASIIAELRRKQVGKPKAADPLGAIRDGQSQVKSDFLMSEIASYQQLADAEAKARAEAEKLNDEVRKRVADAEIGTNAEIAKLQEETKWLGLNTLERRIATEQIKIEAEALKLLEKYPGNAAQIEASAAKRKAGLEASMRSEDAAQKTFGYGWERAFKQYQDSAGNAAKYGENFVTGSLQRTEDALVNFVETGKLDFSSLFKFMADEFIRNQIRMMLAAAMKGGGSSGGGWLGSLLSIAGGFFGGGATSGGGAGMYLGGDAGASTVGMSLAVGTNYVPYDGMPAVLHKGEAVVPAAYNPANGGSGTDGSLHFNNVYNIGQGVSRAEMVQAVEAGNAQMKADLQRQKSRQTGVFR